MSKMRFCDQARDPWNVIAISMAAVLGTALATGVVVANDAGTRKLSAEEPAASLRPVSRCR